MERGPVAGCRVEAHDPQSGLVPRLELGDEPAVGQPVHPGEVVVVVSGVHPGGVRRAGHVDHAEPHDRVRLAGERVAVVLLRARPDQVAALVDDPVDGDVALVDLGEGDEPRVGRPPETLGAVHLLLGDELGEPVRDPIGCRSGEPAGLGAGRGGARGRGRRSTHDVQLSLPDEGDLGPVRRESRAQYRRQALATDDEVGLRRGDIC